MAARCRREGTRGLPGAETHTMMAAGVLTVEEVSDCIDLFHPCVRSARGPVELQLGNDAS